MSETPLIEVKVAGGKSRAVAAIVAVEKPRGLIGPLATGYILRPAMRQTVFGVLLIMSALALGTGCTKCYLATDPPEVKYSDLRRPATPIPVVLTVEDQLNGSRFGGNPGALMKSAKTVFQRSAVFAPIDAKNAEAATAAHIHLVMNEVGSMGEAAGKGAVSGATFGLVGQQMGETIELNASYQPAGGTGAAHDKSYKQIVYIVTGSHKLPDVPGPAYGPFTIGDAVVERLLLNFIKDLQADGAL